MSVTLIVAGPNCVPVAVTVYGPGVGPGAEVGETVTTLVFVLDAIIAPV